MLKHDLSARVAELEALLDQENASREYWERSHASLQRRCTALERDADKMRKMCNQGVHEEARREISRLELRLHRERESAAQERASLHAQVRDLQEKLSVLVKSEASRGSPPKAAATPGLELTARRGGGEERLPPKRISPKSVRASEHGDDVPVFSVHDDGGGSRGGTTHAARTREGVDGGAEGPASPRCSNNGLGRETTPKSVILDILKRASCSNPREQRKEPSSNGPTTQNAPPTTPKSKEDEGYMLVAAAVTMAPREEQGEFLLTLSEKERNGALRWMDPQDVAQALALCPNGDNLLKHMPLAILKPVFACMEAPDRYITLQQRDAEDAAQLVELLAVRAGKMLLGDLHSEALRVQIMDLLQAEWLHRAVADMAEDRHAGQDVAVIQEVLLGLPSPSRDALLGALPSERRHQIQVALNIHS